ncbi:MAG TPA: DUF4382 domain-containing protein [Gammaproteobacteria bacterium]|nr:DUF4382 domain-containing protein [Gammaproteobacteria bacterium]
MSRSLLHGMLWCCLLLLSGCGGSGSSTGLSVYITDAPIDSAIGANIGFTGVTVQGSGGVYAFQFSPVTPDLYQLQGGVEAFLIGDAQIPAGSYHAISLDMNAAPGTGASFLTLADGTLHQIYIPTGEPTRISVPIDFTLPTNGQVNITIDFDLRKSIIQDPNDPTKFILRPVLRAVNNDDQGTISGIVSASLISATTTCSPTVYVYRGDVTPTDVDVNAAPGTTQPVTSALVGLNDTTGAFNFTAAFLPPGAYTVAFTCEANLDFPDSAENIAFTSIKHVTVSRNGNSVVTLD